MAPIKVLTFFIFMSIGTVFSQTIELGVPYCENITPKEIGYGGNMYSIAQDIQGTMYFGNFNGILSYDGLAWKLLQGNGKSILYQDKIGHLYVGGYNSVSEIVYNADNKATISSLIDSLSNFGEVKKIESFQNQIYFLANNSLYYISNRKPQKITSDAHYISFFVERNRLFVSNSQGLFELVDGKLVSNLVSNFFKGIPIIDMFRIDNSLFVRTYDKFYKIFSDNSIEVFTTQIDKEIQSYGYSCCEILLNNTLCIATNNNGIYFINEQGILINYLNTESGLYDNTINDLFVDKANNLWAAFSNGLCRIEIPSAFTYFNKSHGLFGKVNAIVRHKNYMYIGTESGIYRLIKGESRLTNFEKITAFNVSCNSLVSANGKLLAGTNNGLYEIIGSKSNLLYPGKIKNIRVLTNQNLIWITTSTHAFLLKNQGSKVTLIQSIGPIISEINTIAIENDSTIWIGTFFEGVYKISKQQGTYVAQKIVGHGLPKNPWIEVYESSLGIIFSTNIGLYRFDSKISVFYKDNKIGIPKEYKQIRVTPIIEDVNKNLWLAFLLKGTYENQMAVAWNTNNLERYTLISTQFNKLNGFICSTIYPDINSVVWYGGFDGLVRLDFKQLSAKKNNERTRINTITIGKDSVFFYNPESTQSPAVFSYKYNSIRFDFTTPIFENREKLFYTYILEGNDVQWSKPESITSKEFSSLPAGNYVFRVKAIDINGNQTTESSFAFEIYRHPLVSWWAITLYIFLLLAIVTIIYRWRSFLFLKEKSKLSQIIRERTEELLIEKEKTENLLSNILPEQTVRELKEKGRATSMRFEVVTILFSDVQGFTKIAEEMPPDTLIDELDKYFLEFDKIVEQHNIEKIKTIGDAYMCAGGIPEKNHTNPIEVVVAALEMQYRIRMMQQENAVLVENYWGLRIGIHTGSVIAGVVGSKKYSYDIWGDSVNIASRMESSGEVGKVNISESTFVLVQDFFDCEYRGRMPVKYKGEIDMYFVKGFKVIFSEDPLKITPNEFFMHKLALLKFEDLQEKMFERFEKELSKDLYYHNLKHSIDVTVQVEIIGQEENILDKEMLLLKTAALFHDSGFLLGYSEHEELGVQMARNILPKYKYSDAQIQVICELILATKLTHSPKNKLEQIICDADLDYLGRNDYLAVSRDLYRELLEHHIIKKSEAEWNVMQIKFMQNHKYFTASARNRRNASKAKQIQSLQEQTRSFNNLNS